MTPNEQKAATLMQDWKRFVANGECGLERFLATHIVPKLATPDHEASLAACEAYAKRYDGALGYFSRVPQDVIEVGRRSLAAKKPKERWTVERLAHSGWWRAYNLKEFGADFPPDAEPEARAYVARKNAEEAWR